MVQLYLRLLVYLYNDYQKAMSENSQIKEQNERVKLLDKKGRLPQQKHVKPWTNHVQKAFFFRKKLFILCYRNSDNNKIFYILHDKISLLIKLSSRAGEINRQQMIFSKV